MTAQGSAQHVSSVSILIDGTEIDPRYRDLVREVVVQDNLSVPDTAVVRLVQPWKPHDSGGGEPVDVVNDTQFDVGKEIEIKLGALGDRSAATVFKGIVVALEPEFEMSGTTLVLRAYDRSFWMTRGSKTRTYQQKTPRDIVGDICRAYGLNLASCDSNAPQEAYVLQAAESDWDFVQRLARNEACEFVVDGTDARFRRAGATRQRAASIELGVDLISFSPRLSAAQVVDQVTVRSWDAKSSKSFVGRSASAPATMTRTGVPVSKLASTSSKVGGKSELSVATRAVATQKEADLLATSIHQRLAESAIEATGVAFGNPRLKAGSEVEIKGVGTRFNGTYVLSSTTHVYRGGGSGYRTKLTVAGRNSRTLVETLGGGSSGGGAGAGGGGKGGFGGGLVVGIVTNTKDPDKMGRVRVKFPSLAESSSDQEPEGWWARVATLQAGKERGVVFLPEVNDEVVVGFENGDLRRPYVLGSVFSGTNTPGGKLYGDKTEHDGSLLVETPKRFVMNTGDKIEMATSKTYALQSKEGTTQKVGKDLEVTVGGAWITQVDKTVTIETKPGQKIVIKSGGDLDLHAGPMGKVSVKGNQVELNGQMSVDVKAMNINLG